MRIRTIQKTICLLLAACLPLACGGPGRDHAADAPAMADTAAERQAIASMLDAFNRAAATADYDDYFGYFTGDAVFMGTDATEHWDKPAFMAWARPYFDKKTTWDFTAVDRHIYFGPDGGIAWFDELLDTPMKLCRGSGVVAKQDGTWKIAQYVLSMTVPNDSVKAVVGIKAAIEDSLIRVLAGQSPKGQTD